MWRKPFWVRDEASSRNCVAFIPLDSHHFHPPKKVVNIYFCIIAFLFILSVAYQAVRQVDLFSKCSFCSFHACKRHCRAPSAGGCLSVKEGPVNNLPKNLTAFFNMLPRSAVLFNQNSQENLVN